MSPRYLLQMVGSILVLHAKKTFPWFAVICNEEHIFSAYMACFVNYLPGGVFVSVFSMLTLWPIIFVTTKAAKSSV